MRERLTDLPPNAETHLRQLRPEVTPTDAFYIRSNFPVPDIEADGFTLRVRGAGATSEFTLDDLGSLGEVTRRVTLECAGNGRTLLRPAIDGTPWTLGATGTADFTGLSLRSLLDHLDVGAVPTEVLFRGADRGRKEGWGELRFERSLPGAAACAAADGPLLAWAMNGEPLRPEHGAPLRLVVPGWYAVASVKWLEGIELLDAPFSGYFQTDRYRYLVDGETPAPVTRMRVRALLLSPDPEGDRTLDAGTVRLQGIAWTGEGHPTRVEVSTDGGASWRDAGLSPGPAPFTPSRWHLDWETTPGEYDLVVRGHDHLGPQPLDQRWNALGYGNNVAQRVRLTVD